MKEKYVFFPTPRYQDGAWTDDAGYYNSPEFLERNAPIRWPKELLTVLPVPKYHDNQEITYIYYHYAHSRGFRKRGIIRGAPRFGGILRAEANLSFLTPEILVQGILDEKYYVYYFVNAGGHSDTTREANVIG